MKKYIILGFLLLLVAVLRAQNPVFSLPAGLQMTMGETVEVQLSVNTDLSPFDVKSYTFAISYNPARLKVTSVQYDAKLQSFSNVSNIQQSGEVKIAGASTSKITGSGTLITLTFEALAVGNDNVLGFITAECVLNEGTPAATYSNGSINIAAKPVITVSPNSTFLAIGQTTQCNVSGNVTSPVTWGVTNPSVGSISGTGLFTATGHGLTKVFATDAVGLKDTTDMVFEVTAIQLSFPSGLEQWQGWEITIPVKTTDFSSLNVLSGQFSLSYFGDVLQFLGAEKTGTLLENSSVSATETANGKMSLAFAGSQPVGYGTDELIKLRFRVLPMANRATSLTFSNVVFNENIKAVVQTGTFSPKILPALTITPASASLVAGDSLLFTASNGNAPYTWSVSDTRVAEIRQNGRLIAKEGGTTNLTVTDAVGANKTVSGIIVADMRMYFPVDTLENVAALGYTRCLTDSVPAGRPAVSSIEGEISLSNTNLKIIGVEQAGTFTEGWQKIITQVTDQRIKFYLAGSTPFRQKGVAFYLKTEPLPAFKEYDRSDIRFHNTMVNEGIPSPVFIDGSIEGKMFTAQDKTICLGEGTGTLTIPNAAGKIISGWKKRIRRPIATSWVNIANTTATYSDVPTQIGEWEYVAVVDGVNTKIANILVKTIPDVSGVISGNTVFCSVPQTQQYVVERRPTATEYRWRYSGTGVVLHPNENVLNLEITHDVTPGYLVMHTANSCGQSADSLMLELKPTIQPAGFSYDNTVIYYNRDTISFTDTSVGALSWTWSVSPATGVSFVEGTTSNSQHPKIQFNQSGDFKVKLEAQNSCRIDSVSQVITIQQFKNGILTTANNTGCLGTTFNIEFSQSTGTIEVWQVQKAGETTWTDLSAPAASPLSYSPATAGNYTIRVKLADDRGYSGTIAITVYTVPVKPVIVASCSTLSVNSENTVNWYKNGEYTTVLSTGKTFTPQWDVLYVAQIVANGCQSPYSDPVSISRITGTDIIAACDSYTWIDGITYTENNNTATHTLVGGAKNGCDSIVTLNLTVTKISVQVTLDNHTLTAQESDAIYQWFKNGILITGATARSYTTVENGKYSVKITKNSCIKVSDEIEVNLSSVRLVGPDNNLKVYPNPTEKWINVDFSGTFSKVEISVYNSMGILIGKQTFYDGRKAFLQLSGETGIYFLRIKLDNTPDAFIKVVKK